MSSPKPEYVIRLADGVYLDNLNNFHPLPPVGVPMYLFPDGDVPITPATRQALLGQTLAVLPKTNDPGWKTFLTDNFMIDDKSVKIIEKGVAIVSGFVTVIGWYNAAVSILNALHLLQDEPSVQQLLSQILSELSTIKRMLADSEKNAVVALIESSRHTLQTSAANVHQNIDDMHAGDTVARQTVNEREAEAQTALRNLLGDAVGNTFFLIDEYKPMWFFPIFHQILHTMRGEDGAPVPLPQFPADGSFPFRFDYRHVLPDVLTGIGTYLTIIKDIEPEYRSTQAFHTVLLGLADAVDHMVEKMRACLGRTVYTPRYFWGLYRDQVDEFFDVNMQLAARPKAETVWTVGAIDLCTGTGAYYGQLFSATYPPGYYPVTPKLGTWDQSWRPSNLKLEFVPEEVTGVLIQPAYWKITNPEECANEANQQADADYITLMGVSGFLNLAQFATTLRHLATDPESSETVLGTVIRRRHVLEPTPIQVTTRQTFSCPPQAFDGLLRLHQCRALATITTQPPGRPASRQLAYAFHIVALPSPGFAGRPLFDMLVGPGANHEVVIEQASVFDWYLAVDLESQIETLSDRIALNLAGKIDGSSKSLITATPTFTYGNFGRWTQSDNDEWAAEIRNERYDRVKLNLAFERETNVHTITLISQPDQPNVRWLYLLVEETLKSGRKLRTYIDLSMNTKFVCLPKAFFEHEKACISDEHHIIDGLRNQLPRRHIGPGIPSTTLGQEHILPYVNRAAPQLLDQRPKK